MSSIHFEKRLREIYAESAKGDTTRDRYRRPRLLSTRDRYTSELERVRDERARRLELERIRSAAAWLAERLGVDCE